MEDITPNVLLVDDAEVNLEALEALLCDLGCKLTRANGGNQALEQLAKHDFAVMLLDVKMPQMDGYEVAKRARQNPATRDVPIIFLTGIDHTEESMLRGYGSGAVDFLMKPANSYVLRAKVQVFLDLYVSRRRLTSEITAHKRTLAALELANTALRHFTNAASHDLKAPLRAMRGFLGALHEDAGANLGDKASGYLDRSIQASRRMDSLLSSLLAYARLQKPPSCTLVPCQPLLEQVKADLAEQLDAANAVVSLGELPTVKGDPERLYQLFLNLISNAIKFHRTDVPPIVAVCAEPQGNQSMFCVQDNGIGIGLEHREAVFTAFRRLHSESAYEGAGLGLAICKQIVEEHGGRIWVDSEPRRGSRFCLTLPLASDGGENPARVGPVG